MRIFLDTNVLVSAFATRGLGEDILPEVITFHQFVSSKTVLAELEHVLKRKFAVTEQICTEIQDFLRSNVILTEDSNKLKLSLSDEADINIVSEAVTANVDVFVTGDTEVAELKQVQGMRILSPREFWELLQTETVEIP
jgi:putative PIN family toxin of toxin-antitoxin system